MLMLLLFILGRNFYCQFKTYCACATMSAHVTLGYFVKKMAENLIPGLDGDIPAERGLLPDSLNLKKTNGETVGYAAKHPAGGRSSGPVVTQAQVRL